MERQEPVFSSHIPDASHAPLREPRAAGDGSSVCIDLLLLNALFESVQLQSEPKQVDTGDCAERLAHAA